MYFYGNIVFVLEKYVHILLKRGSCLVGNRIFQKKVIELVTEVVYLLVKKTNLISIFMNSDVTVCSFS